MGEGPSPWGCKVQPDRKRIPWKLEARAGAGCSLLGSPSAKDRLGPAHPLPAGTRAHSVFHGSSLEPPNQGFSSWGLSPWRLWIPLPAAQESEPYLSLSYHPPGNRRDCPEEPCVQIQLTMEAGPTLPQDRWLVPGPRSGHGPTGHTQKNMCKAMHCSTARNGQNGAFQIPTARHLA